MSDEKVEPDFTCPECGCGIWGDLSAKARARSRMTFIIEPKDGDLLGLAHVGSMMVEMQKLLVAMGKDMGLKTVVVVEKLSSEDGKIKVDMLIGRQKGSKPVVTSEESK